jgi:Leucine-rich repeat (LRR) protein
MKHLWYILPLLFILSCEDKVEKDTTPPNPVKLYSITYQNGSFTITWSQNNDDDFSSYKLYESMSEDMSDDTLIYQTDDRTGTTFIKTIQNLKYYQIVVEDGGGLQSTSNIVVGDYDVPLWGVYYSVLNTTYLNLSGNQLTGSIPPEIGNMTNLERLTIINNEQLTGTIPPEIGNLTNLTHLKLYNNQLTGSIPPEIGNLTNLKNLILHHNELTGSIPSEIGNLTNLTTLSLNNTQLTGSIPSEIGNLSDLHDLNLNDTQLSGSIPSEIGNLTNLTELVSYNSQLTGSIPSEIGNLTKLTYLNLSGNQLTGSIPPEIGNMTILTHLKLNDNQLTGKIPESICNLYLGSGLVSFHNNQLCPPYPSCIQDYVGTQDTSNCG